MLSDRMEFHVEIHLSSVEYSTLVLDAIHAGVSPGEMLRRAYFETPRSGQHDPQWPHGDPAPQS